MADLRQQIEAVRRFSRFYTRRIGVLEEGLLHSPFSLTEARIIYELAHREPVSATVLGEELGLDAGHLSRVIAALARRGVVVRSASPDDGRVKLLTLTQAGRREFANLNEASRVQVESMLSGLDGDEQVALVESMATIRGILGDDGPEPAPYLLRPPVPGDLGWVVQTHARLYHHEYGWNEEFEGLVADIVSTFIRQFDPDRERCWIAEKDGDNVGSVFLVKKSDRVAQLRLLLVSPAARGSGIGGRLVHECTRFARSVGYGSITLWTNSNLHAARRLYEREGYRLVDEEPHHSFGHDLVGQIWEMTL